MYHKRFKGSHYEMGYHFGSQLAKNNFFITKNIPFPLTQERKDFALSCIPIYQYYFPEILEEIEGLALGQQCDVTQLYTLLLSMYAMPPTCNCSCFAIRNQNSILLGRNSNFLTALEKNNLNVIYRFSNDSYAFTGNTTAFIEIEDGINEHGLALGLTSIYPTAIKSGFNAGMLVRYFLEKCKTTEEVLRHIQQLPISSAQTLTVADKTGDIAVIEAHSEKLTIIRPSCECAYVCATNQFSSNEMHALQDSSIDNWQAAKRYNTLTSALEKYLLSFDKTYAQQLLSGQMGFLCQYNRSTGKDTVWSVLYDLKNNTINRVEGNPCRRNFKEDKRFFK